jgi:hypothetical protein
MGGVRLQHGLPVFALRDTIQSGVWPGPAVHPFLRAGQNKGRSRSQEHGGSGGTPRGRPLSPRTSSSGLEVLQQAPPSYLLRRRRLGSHLPSTALRRLSITRDQGQAGTTLLRTVPRRRAHQRGRCPPRPASPRQATRCLPCQSPQEVRRAATRRSTSAADHPQRRCDSGTRAGCSLPSGSGRPSGADPLEGPIRSVGNLGRRGLFPRQASAVPARGRVGRRGREMSCGAKHTRGSGAPGTSGEQRQAHQRARPPPHDTLAVRIRARWQLVLSLKIRRFVSRLLGGLLAGC